MISSIWRCTSARFGAELLARLSVAMRFFSLARAELIVHGFGGGLLRVDLGRDIAQLLVDRVEAIVGILDDRAVQLALRRCPPNVCRA